MAEPLTPRSTPRAKSASDYRTQARRAAQRREANRLKHPDPVPCRECGKAIEYSVRSPDWKVCCSAECRWKRLNRRFNAETSEKRRQSRTIPRSCGMCGATFMAAQRLSQVYCSKDCQRVGRWRQAGYPAELVPWLMLVLTYKRRLREMGVRPSRDL